MPDQQKQINQSVVIVGLKKLSQEYRVNIFTDPEKHYHFSKYPMLQNYLERASEHSFTIDQKINRQWVCIYEYSPEDFCRCGRKYGDGDTAFRLRIRNYVSSDAKFKEWLNSPILCKFCWYSHELQQGNWAPKVVVESFGHPVNDPGDGRSLCNGCKRYVWPVIHSCPWPVDKF